MNRCLLGVVATMASGGAMGALVVLSGLINVAASEPHSPLVHQFLAFARERSIASRSADIQVPQDLAEHERIRRGSGNYEAMCATCHLSPAGSDSELRQGLYPTPPNLAGKPDSSIPARNPARDFWIIKHGIKASAMPAWSKGGMEDEAIWDLTAFLQKMPLLTKDDYARLVASSDGHSHGGLANHADEHDDRPSTSAPAIPAKPRQKTASHDHAQHRH